MKGCTARASSANRICQEEARMRFKKVAVGGAKAQPTECRTDSISGIGAEPAGAFENTKHGVERYAAARSNTGISVNR
ncbi:MAG: hypothetical protein NC241_05430 [Bacteroides sp.]|nr:hypothetical protein [Bacteroides sp.]